MSNTEYEQKKENIQTSQASIQDRERALEWLEFEYRGDKRRNDKILADMHDGMSDLKMGEI